MIYGITFSDNSPCLKHHGVKGQKWGVLHGPPYPLDDSISNGKRLVDKVTKKSRRKDLSGNLSQDIDKMLGINNKSFDDVFSKADMAAKAANNWEGNTPDKTNCWSESLAFMINMERLYEDDYDNVLVSSRSDLTGIKSSEIDDLIYDNLGERNKRWYTNPNFDGLQDGQYWIDGRKRSKQDCQGIVNDFIKNVYNDTPDLSKGNDDRFGILNVKWMGSPSGHVTNYVIHDGKMEIIECQEGGKRYDPIDYLQNCRDISFYTPLDNSAADNSRLTGGDYLSDEAEESLTKEERDWRKRNYSGYTYGFK